MYRTFEKKLQDWKKNNCSKPLMLVGARQTGKTYILDKFCKENFEHYYYFNLSLDKDILDIFKYTINPEKIIEQIELVKGQRICFENSVFFFDEIQESEEAIESLKYFCESKTHYNVVCAGSLLGVKLNRLHSSFPVGKVELQYFYTMNFMEFLMALGEEPLILEIRKHFLDNTPMLDVIHQKALHLYKTYLILGGMPELVQDYINHNKNINEVQFDRQRMIVDSYLFDMNKYTENTESIKNNAIYRAIPSALLKENSCFKFSNISESARKTRYENSLNWLEDSNMVLKCILTERNSSPFAAYANYDRFKLYLNDVGLLRALANIDYREILLDKNEMFKGALIENFVAEELFAKNRELYYYRFNKYEIDFLIKIEGDVIPVEVKSGKRTTSKSLNAYIEKYKPIYSIRISEKNFGFENNIKSVPLYALFCI